MEMKLETSLTDRDRLKKVGLIFSIGLTIFLFWFILLSYVFAFKRLMLLSWLALKRLIARVARLFLTLFSRDRKISNSEGSFFVRMHKRIYARAVVEFFNALQIKNSQSGIKLLNFFIEKCKRLDASAQIISSTAGMAISLGENKEALRLLSILIERYPSDVSAQQQVGVKAFILGKYKLAEIIWTLCSAHREDLIIKLGLDKLKARFLAPSWYLAIGHIAHLDIYLKHKILNGHVDHKTYFSLPAGMQLPNSNLMSYWSDYISTLDKDTLKNLSPNKIGILQDEFWSIPFEDGKSRMFSHAGSMVQQRWEAEERTPLLNIKPADRLRGEDTLRELGVPANSWFVCLHVREPGFHLKWHKSHPGTRNADIETYLPAARELVARGGYVIRLGDSSMRPLTKEKGIIDYALSKYKSEFMDVFLCGACRFFIGTNSGLGLIPPIFGIPCAMTNWSPIGLPQWYLKDVYIPKLIFSERLSRNLTFEEMLFSEAGWSQFEKYLVKSGLQTIDNTPEEITELVLEMLDKINGEVTLTDNDQKLRKTFNDLVLRADSYIGAQLGMGFLRRHQALLATSTTI